MKHVAILGSTGSIGKNALSVIKQFPDEFQATVLSANSDIRQLQRQIREFRPKAVCVCRRQYAARLRPQVGSAIKVFAGPDGLSEVIRKSQIDIVLLAISGAAALPPLLQAIEAGHDVAMANKEALVSAGALVIDRAEKKKVRIIPVDSEQSAIWQCLRGEEKKHLKRIYLTASGGPLRTVNKKLFSKITLKQVLKHPRWRMGRKITVDSATLMNKGLEVLEAMYLFGVSADKISIVIHPQSIIHSMVEFQDGVVLAQLSVPDMRVPIQYALSYPKRLPGCIAEIDFFKLGRFDFEEPDFRKFPCLALAYRVAEESGTAPCVLNAANEASVHEFLRGRLKFSDIPRVIEQVLSRHHNIKRPGLEDIEGQDNWARRQAREIIGRLN